MINQTEQVIQNTESLKDTTNKEIEELLNKFEQLDPEGNESQVTEDELVTGLNRLKPLVFPDMENSDSIKFFLNNEAAFKLFAKAYDSFSMTMPWLKRAAKVASPEYIDTFQKRFFHVGDKENIAISMQNLIAVRKAFDSERQNNNKLIGLTVYGSNSRGEAKITSDFDGACFYLDENPDFTDLVGDEVPLKPWEINGPSDCYSAFARLRGGIANGLSNEIGYGHFNDFHLYPISNKLIEQAVEELDGKDPVVAESAYTYLESIFHLSLGRTSVLANYRRVALDNFRNLEVAGNAKWERFVNRLATHEAGIVNNGEIPAPLREIDQRYYPKSLQEAYSIFG